MVWFKAARATGPPLPCHRGEICWKWAEAPPKLRAMQDLIAKAAMLLEALPYIQKFSGATFVVKYGGSFMDSPIPRFATGWRGISCFWRPSK